ncbi:MAG: histidine kinase [Nocardiopsaceae bacterium]|jgi:signal transduction histidine kinase|nr:histidine kinase [Nocardiopsaceae bacterium]
MTGRPLVRDAIVPAFLAVLTTLELGIARPEGWAYSLALNLLGCAFLAVRRPHPLIICTLAVAVPLLGPWVGPPLPDAGSTGVFLAAVAVYYLGHSYADLRGLAGVAVIGLEFLAVYSFADARRHDFSDVVTVGTILLGPYVFGRVTRRLYDQTALIEANMELVARQAVLDERSRIAREAHDVVAHSLNAMVVQAAVAHDLVEPDPDRAERVLAAIAATGRRALQETARLATPDVGLTPMPGLAGVPSLVERFRHNGLTVSVTIDEPIRDLPAGVDVSAYRIIQELLTNALKYAADRSADLRVTATPNALEIRATNASTGGTGNGSGLGLLGMAERVALQDGSLSHGIGPNGRFQIVVVLPVAI